VLYVDKISDKSSLRLARSTRGTTPTMNSPQPKNRGGLQHADTIPSTHLELLTTTPAFANLATLTSNGFPQVTPVWIDFDGTVCDHQLAKGRLKDRNMRARKQVGLAINDQPNPYAIWHSGDGCRNHGRGWRCATLIRIGQEASGASTSIHCASLVRYGENLQGQAEHHDGLDGLSDGEAARREARIVSGRLSSYVSRMRPRSARNS